MYRPRGQDVGRPCSAKGPRDEVKHGQPEVKTEPGTTVGQIQTVPGLHAPGCRNQALLLDPASGFFDHGRSHFHDVERVQDGDRLGQLAADSVRKAAERIQRRNVMEVDLAAAVPAATTAVRGTGERGQTRKRNQSRYCQAHSSCWRFRLNSFKASSRQQ